MNEYLRPDERAAQTDIERSKKQDERIKSGVKTAAGIASTVAGAGLASKFAGPIASRVMPFINKYIPTDLAIKGISKVSPELGNLLKKGMNQGLDIKDGLEFIKNQIEGPAKQNGNIIEQYSPELHEFIANKVSAGHSPIAVANLAQKDKKFADIIKKLAKDHKTDWASIVESIYGGGEYGGAVNPKEEALKKFKEHQKKKGLVEQEIERFQQGYGQQPQQGQAQQPGKGQEALMAILQKLQQSRGGQ